MTSHTPGPWHVGVKPGPMIYNETDDQIADMHDPMPYIDNSVNLANARLIASAPELLAALRAIAWLERQRISEGFNPTSPTSPHGRAHADVIAAIAKATGVQS